jgi:predicted nucleic acid-binding Zn ribbon protein
MSTTLLRLGLWTVILVLVLYVLASTYPEAPWAELIPMPMLQQALALGAIVVAIGVVLRILGKGAQAVTVKNRCRVCRRSIPTGALYCREHLHAILADEDEKTHVTRIRR